MLWSELQTSDRLVSAGAAACVLEPPLCLRPSLSQLQLHTMETILSILTVYTYHAGISPPLTFHLGFLIDIWASGQQDRASCLKINIVVRKSGGVLRCVRGWRWETCSEECVTQSYSHHPTHSPTPANPSPSHPSPPSSRSMVSRLAVAAHTNQ